MMLEAAKEKSRKEYLGDGVYIDHDGYQFKLTTEDGYSETNTIYLDPQVVDSLLLYIAKRIST